MSTLDQAFIRAYGSKHSPQGAATIERPTESRPPARPPAEARPQGRPPADRPSANPADPAFDVEELYRDTSHYSRVAVPVVPPPHAVFSYQTTSSPTGSEPAVLAGPVAEADVPLRPAFEVEEFVWPPFIGTVTTLCEPAFHRALAELAAVRQDGTTVLGVAGCRPAAGCTTLVLALARLLAGQQLRVVMVDADYENPTLAASLGLDVASGWEEAMAGDQSVDEALVESLADQVHLLPLCKRPRAGIAQAGAIEAIRRLRAAYDIVLVDLGHILGEPPPDLKRWDRVPASEVRVPSIRSRATDLAPAIDLAIVVRDCRFVPAEQSADVGRAMAAAGARHWTVCENFAGK